MEKTRISTYVWPGQTRVGYGAVELVGKEAKGYQATNAFILSDPGVEGAGLLRPVLASLEDKSIPSVVYTEIPGNPDVAAVDAAGRAFRDSAADLIVAVGGGSVLDAAKGVRLLAGGPPEASIGEYALILRKKARPAPRRHEMPPMIAIPTTAGTGSEVTPWGVITDKESQFKFGIGGRYLLPDTALVDPGLTLTLPPTLTAATGLDALSHLVEAYVSTNNNPALDPLILYGIELLGRSLRVTVGQPGNRDARYDVMLASMLAGIAISSNWLGACHSLAHQLSSFADLHHGTAIALMLPHQMAFSLDGALERYGHIAKALDRQSAQAERAPDAVRELITDVGLPTQLRNVGISEEMIPALAASAYRDLNWTTNPCLISEADMETLYRQAY